MAASAEGLRPIPRQSVFKKFKLRAQFLWPAATLAVLGLVIFVLQNKPQSQLQIKAHQDKFKIEFALIGKDRAKAERILVKLALPQSVLEGQEFELDSTSAARLAFASPIILDLEVKDEQITFSGASRIPLEAADLAPSSTFKLPSSTHLVIYGRDLSQILKKRFGTMQPLDVWLDQNLMAVQGQYLTLFTPDTNFALSFKPQIPPDWQSLAQIKTADGQSSYKQELADDIVIHLVKVPGTEPATLAIFEIDQWVHITTSLESARQLLAVQEGNAPFVNFPKTRQNVSFVIYFKRTDTATADSISQIIKNGQKSTKYIENIKEAFIMLDRREISGYIDF